MALVRMKSVAGVGGRPEVTLADLAIGPAPSSKEGCPCNPASPAAMSGRVFTQAGPEADIFSPSSPIVRRKHVSACEDFGRAEFDDSGSGSPTSADEGKRTRGGIVCPLDRGEAGRSRAGNSLIT